MSDDNDDGDPMDKALGVGPLKPDFSKAVSNIVNEIKNDSANKDFETARQNVISVISNSNDAIAKLCELANQSQDIKAFEALAKLMTSSLEASKALLLLQKNIREVSKADEPINATDSKSVTNNLYVGTTAELSKIMDDIKSKSKSL